MGKMSIERLKSEKGITLIELLVSLVIVSIIGTLAYQFLFNAIAHSEKTKSHIDIRQEAHYVLSTLHNLHDGDDYQLCYRDDQNLYLDSSSNLLLADGAFTFALHDIHSVNLSSERTSLDPGNCKNVDTSRPLFFHATLIGPNEEQLEIDTVIGRHNISQDNRAEKSDRFYDYLKTEEVFLFGDHLDLFGSTSILPSETAHGTILLRNMNEQDLIFNGNNSIHLKNIFINKQGNDIIFNNSTTLGLYESTETVHLKGNVILNNGAAVMNGNDIFIEGDVYFNNSAEINGRNVYVKGDITFDNWSGKLTAETIYVSGHIREVQPENIIGDVLPLESGMITDNTEQSQFLSPPLRQGNWFDANGYERGGGLADGQKVFSKNGYAFSNTGSQNKYEDVIIVAENGDITLSNHINLSGVLIAPNGKVSFDSGSFEGVVIARDGFYVTNGGTSVQYNNIQHYIHNEDHFPFDPN